MDNRPAGFNLYAQNIKDELENWGAPPQGAKFHISDSVVRTSVYTIAANTSIPTVINFFEAGSQNTTLSTDVYPLNGRAVSILGLRIQSCLKLTLTDPALANEQQQGLEATSVFAISYRNRSNWFQAPMSELVPNNNYLDGSDVVTGLKVPQWHRLKSPIKYGATQPISFTLSIPSGYTTAVSTGANVPSLGGGVGSTFWVALELLTEEYTSI